MYDTAWTHIRILALRQVDLEPCAKRGNNRPRALVSLYWLSWSLHLKQSSNEIPYNSRKIGPIRSSWICKKSDQIPKSYALFSISKKSFSKLPGQLILVTGVLSGVVIPKDKIKSNPFAREKVRILSKSVVIFGSFYSQKATSIKAWKLNDQG